MPNLNNIIQFSSAVVLLIISSALAFAGKPTEMGLAIAAGALGLAFSNIDKISKFKGAGFEAEMKDNIQAVIDKETEFDTDETVFKYAKTELNKDQQKVISALANPAFTWRTATGISNESKLSPEIVSKELINLINLDFAQQGRDKNKKVIWAPNKRGRNAAIIMAGDLNEA